MIFSIILLNGTYNIQSMFYNCKKLTTSINSNYLWNNLNIQCISNNAFYNCKNIINYDEIPATWK